MAKNLIIAVLGIALIICLYFLYDKSGVTEKGHVKTDRPEVNDFIKEMHDSNAKKRIKDFRDNYRLDISKGVYYDSADLRNYLDVVYPYLKARTGADTSLYSWKIGFYCMRRPKGTDEGPIRLDFLVVPTLVRKTDAFVIDFYDSSHYYKPRPGVHTPPITDPPCTNCTGYDAGQLWP